jgi:hypothetical protein
VPGSLTDLIQKLSQSANDAVSKNILARFTKVKQYFQGVGEVRIFIANSQNFGHQSSSVNILRNLIRMGCAGPYTLALYGNGKDDVLDLVQKLHLLIVEFPGLNKQFDMGGCKVTAVSLLDGALKPGPFAITGGYDDTQKEVPYNLLNVSNYVQLQPYAWHKGRNLVHTGPAGGGETWDLDKDNPTTNLARRAFYLPLGATPDWGALEKTYFKTQAAIVKYLTDEVTAGRIHLLPVYGIKTEGYPYASLYNIVAGTLAAQVAFAPAARKTVVVGLEILKPGDLDAFRGYCIDVTGKSDLFEVPDKPSAGFINWNELSKVDDRAKWFTKLDLNDLQQKIAALKADNVLYFPLGRVPTVLFNFLYEKASLPPVFEGQNTAELMLNIGKPYFKIGREKDNVSFGYPTLPLSSRTSGAMAKLSSNASFNGLFMAKPSAWAVGGPLPPVDLPELFGAYLGVGQDIDPNIAPYFASLGKFFHDELNDKLLRGLDLFVNLIGPVKAGQLMAETVALVKGSDLLEKLYESLNANLKNGQIDLFAVTANWLLGTFFAPLVTGKTFVVDNAAVAIDDEQTQVTLTGTTTALGIGTTSLNFVFTDDKGVICSALGAVFTEATWSLGGAPWLSLAKPGLQLTLDQNAAVPVVGKVTVSLSAGFSMDVAVTLPSEPGNVLLQAIFTGNKPSITNSSAASICRHSCRSNCRSSAISRRRCSSCATTTRPTRRPMSASSSARRAEAGTCCPPSLPPVSRFPRRSRIRAISPTARPAMTSAARSSLAAATYRSTRSCPACASAAGSRKTARRFRCRRSSRPISAMISRRPCRNRSRPRKSPHLPSGSIAPSAATRSRWMSARTGIFPRRARSLSSISSTLRSTPTPMQSIRVPRTAARRSRWWARTAATRPAPLSPARSAAAPSSCRTARTSACW